MKFIPATVLTTAAAILATTMCFAQTPTPPGRTTSPAASTAPPAADASMPHQRETMGNKNQTMKECMDTHAKVTGMSRSDMTTACNDQMKMQQDRMHDGSKMPAPK